MITKETFIQMINLVERFNEEINRWNDFGLNIWFQYASSRSLYNC